MAIHFNVPKLGFRYYLSFPHSGRCLLEVQFSSVAQSCLTFCDPMDCSMSASLSTTNSRSLLKLMSIRSVMPSNQSHPLLSPSPPALQGFPSIRVFFSKSVLHIRWPKYWSFSFSISPSNESSGLISFRVDWLDFLAVQGTLKSLLQHHSSEASTLQCSAFFMVQLSHSYIWELETLCWKPSVGNLVRKCNFFLHVRKQKEFWIEMVYWVTKDKTKVWSKIVNWTNRYRSSCHLISKNPLMLIYGKTNTIL